MKIVHVCNIANRGTALFTDQLFRNGDFLLLRVKKSVRVVCGTSVFTFELKGIEAALKDRRDYLGFMVPTIHEEAMRNALVGASAELQ